MATANDTDDTLFNRLAKLRSSVQQVIAEVYQLIDAIPEPEATESWNAEEDLARQVVDAADALELAADFLQPGPEHPDLMLPLSEEEVHATSSVESADASLGIVDCTAATTTHEANYAEKRSPGEWKEDVIASFAPFTMRSIEMLHLSAGYYRFPEATHEKLRAIAKRILREMEAVLWTSRVERAVDEPSSCLVASSSATDGRSMQAASGKTSNRARLQLVVSN